MVIKKPLEIDYDKDSIDDIVKMIEYAIEQHPSFLKVQEVEDYHKSEKELNKKREFWDMY